LKDIRVNYYFKLIGPLVKRRHTWSVVFFCYVLLWFFSMLTINSNEHHHHHHRFVRSKLRWNDIIWHCLRSLFKETSIALFCIYFKYRWCASRKTKKKACAL